MAKKAGKREDVFLQCSDCGDLNYRTSVSVAQGSPKLELTKYCPRTRQRTVHKVKRK